MSGKTARQSRLEQYESSRASSGRRRERRPRTPDKISAQNQVFRILWNHFNRSMDMWRLCLLADRQLATSNGAAADTQPIAALAVETRVREDLRRRREDECFQKIVILKNLPDYPLQGAHGRSALQRAAETVLIDVCTKEGLLDLEASGLAAHGEAGGASEHRAPGSLAKEQWEAALRDVACSEDGGDRLLAVSAALGVLPPSHDPTSNAKPPSQLEQILGHVYRSRARMDRVMMAAGHAAGLLLGGSARGSDPSDSDGGDVAGDSVLHSIAGQRSAAIQQGLAGVLNAELAVQRRARQQEEAERHRREGLQINGGDESGPPRPEDGGAVQQKSHPHAGPPHEVIRHLMGGEFTVTPRRATMSREHARPGSPARTDPRHSSLGRIQAVSVELHDPSRAWTPRLTAASAREEVGSLGAETSTSSSSLPAGIIPAPRNSPQEPVFAPVVHQESPSESAHRTQASLLDGLALESTGGSSMHSLGGSQLSGPGGSSRESPSVEPRLSGSAAVYRRYRLASLEGMEPGPVRKIHSRAQVEDEDEGGDEERTSVQKGIGTSGSGSSMLELGQPSSLHESKSLGRSQGSWQGQPEGPPAAGHSGSQLAPSLFAGSLWSDAQVRAARAAGDIRRPNGGNLGPVTSGRTHAGPSKTASLAGTGVAKTTGGNNTSTGLMDFEAAQALAKRRFTAARMIQARWRGWSHSRRVALVVATGMHVDRAVDRRGRQATRVRGAGRESTKEGRHCLPGMGSGGAFESSRVLPPAIFSADTPSHGRIGTMQVALARLRVTGACRRIQRAMLRAMLQSRAKSARSMGGGSSMLTLGTTAATATGQSARHAKAAVAVQSAVRMLLARNRARSMRLEREFLQTHSRMRCSLERQQRRAQRSAAGMEAWAWARQQYLAELSRLRRAARLRSEETRVSTIRSQKKAVKELLRPLDVHERRWIEQRVPVRGDELRSMQARNDAMERARRSGNNGRPKDPFSNEAHIPVGRGQSEVVLHQRVWYKLEYLDSTTGLVTDVHPRMSELKDRLQALRAAANRAIQRVGQEARTAHVQSARKNWEASQSALDAMYEARLQHDNGIRAAVRRERQGILAMPTLGNRGPGGPVPASIRASARAAGWSMPRGGTAPAQPLRAIGLGDRRQGMAASSSTGLGTGAVSAMPSVEEERRPVGQAIVSRTRERLTSMLASALSSTSAKAQGRVEERQRAEEGRAGEPIQELTPELLAALDSESGASESGR